MVRPTGTAGSASAVRRFYDAFNAGDLAAYAALLTEDVTVEVDTATLHGPDEVCAYVAGVQHAFPGIAAEPKRVVDGGDGTVVVELHQRNPAGDTDPDAWILAGTVCEVITLREERIAAVRSYYLPHPDDRTPVAQMPSRNKAYRVADEQHALRRVAILVAQGVSETEVFDAVSEAVGRLAGADAAALVRFDRGDTVTMLAAWSRIPAAYPVGEPRPLTPKMRRLRDSVVPCRFIDALPGGPPVEGPGDVRGGIGVPVLVDGAVWGAIVVAAGPEPLPVEEEARIMGFTELVATSIASAQARVELQRLADEQAALRRVAELVAGAAPSQQVLDAVVGEASDLLGRAGTSLLRFQPDGDAVVVAARGQGPPVGTVVSGIHQAHGFTDVLAEGLASGPGADASVAAPVMVEARVWGVLTMRATDLAPSPGAEARLAQFAALVGTAIANAESRAELAASRARVVAAADESRRRLQRDVHDSAQQRLVQTIVNLRLALQALDEHPWPGADLIRESLLHAERASTELGDIVRGILPTLLTRRGLRAGVESLCVDLPVPVELDVVTGRLPPRVETTAYFVVAEALTNVVKHAHATSAAVTATSDGEALTLVVADDGVGGADPARGSGLTGLSDRVAAGNGTLAVESDRGKGTRLTVVLPLDRT